MGALAAVAAAAAAMVAIAGGWTLESVQDGPQLARDPRWAFTLAFDAGGAFALDSTVAVEKHVSGAPPGAARERVQGVIVPVSLRGTYRVAGPTLILAIKPPPSGPARDFALANFGYPLPDGTFRPRVAVAGGLTLTNPTTGRVLRFERRKRPIAGGPPG